MFMKTYLEVKLGRPKEETLASRIMFSFIQLKIFFLRTDISASIPFLLVLPSYYFDLINVSWEKYSQRTNRSNCINALDP